MTMVQLDQVDEFMRSLVAGEYGEAILGFNEHTIGYCDASTAYEERDELQHGWISPEEREKALNENSVWSLFWNPATPVGSHTVLGSTLRSVVIAALEINDPSAVRLQGVR